MQSTKKAMHPWDLVVVTGLPRSGTSMMMRMLEAGGLPVATDHARPADASNPRGYYELDRIKRLADDPAILRECRGSAIKVIYALVYALDPSLRYRLIVMRRDLSQVLASQRLMLARAGKVANALDASVLKDELGAFDAWVGGCDHLDSIDVGYENVLNQPDHESRRVADFIGSDLDIQTMSACVEPALWRNR